MEYFGALLGALGGSALMYSLAPVNWYGGMLLLAMTTMGVLGAILGLLVTLPLWA